MKSLVAEAMAGGAFGDVYRTDIYLTGMDVYSKTQMN